MNGVYKYGASGFPTLSYSSTNYWVDVVYTQTAQRLCGHRSHAELNATNVATNASVSVIFTMGVDPTTVTAGTVELLDANSAVVPGTLSYDPGRNRAVHCRGAAIERDDLHDCRQKWISWSEGYLR